MKTLLRSLMLAIVALAPAGCDWCTAPDFVESRTTTTVRDASGAVLGEAAVTLGWIDDGRDDGTVGIAMTGPPQLADSARAGWAAGGPLQGWTATVRIEDARGAVLLQARAQRAGGHAVFYPTGGPVTKARFHAMRAALESGRATIVIETIDDPRVPLPGPVRATLPSATTIRSKGSCT